MTNSFFTIMRKIAFTLIIITCAIINAAAQVAASLKSDAISGNWSDPIWEINYNGNSYENLIDLPTNILNGQIQLYFENSAQLNMEAFSGNPPFKNIIYNLIMFANNDGRTINGTSKITVKTISNWSYGTHTFNVPVEIKELGTLDVYAPLIFKKAFTSTASDITLTANEGAIELQEGQSYYVFENTVNTKTLNINAKTIFNSKLTCFGLNIAQSAKKVTFKDDVQVNGDAIGNGVSNYEKTLNITGNLTTNDTTAIQMHTQVGENCYINAPLYILDTLRVGGDIRITGNTPVIILQSLDRSRKGWLRMVSQDNEISMLHIYNGGSADLRNGTINHLAFKGAWNEGTANEATNVLLINETIKTLSMFRTANESRKLPISGSNGTNNVTINSTKIEMDFPNPSRYYCVGFPFDVTVSGSPTEIAEYDGSVRSNGGAGWGLATGNTLKAGKGYAIMSNTPVTFTATNTGAKFTQATGTLPLTYYKGTSTYQENYGWNLVTTPFANPQPLNITEGMFVYRYVPEKDSYTTLETGDAFTPHPFEAFFIKTAEGTETAEFGATQASMPSRIARATQPRIELSLLADGYEYSTRINYNDNATTAYDALYDAPFSGGMMPNATWFYSFCAGQNGQYAINAVPEEIESINLGFRLMNTNGGTSYTITWNNEAGMDLELYDAEMQIATDMVSLNSYSFMVANDGINTERFVIRKKNASGTTTSIEEVSENKNILIQEGTIIINTENSAHISIYDIMGHVIAEGDNKGQQQYNIGQPGIYVVKINGEATKVLVK